MRCLARITVCMTLAGALLLAGGACDETEPVESAPPSDQATEKQTPGSVQPGAAAPAAAGKPGGMDLPPPSTSELPPGHPPIGGAAADAPPAKEAAPAAAPLEGPLTVAGIELTVPKGWARQKPKSAIRLAQMSLPGEAGPATLTAFCFGKGSGGSIEANMDRWVDQIGDPKDADGDSTASFTDFEQNGVKVHVVQATGEYAPDSMGGPGGPKAPQAGTSLYGLIVENGPQGNVFIKITGPEPTIKSQMAALEAFARSARLAE